MCAYCEYCNPWKAKPILASWHGRVVIERGKLRMMVRRHGGAHEDGGTAKVRYCPMCGRKL